jgi:excisionase family DNA binding protein
MQTEIRPPIKRVGYTITEVAEMTGRNRSTIHRWLEKGVLRAIHVPGGKRMVQAQSLERLINGRAAMEKLTAAVERLTR